MTRTPTDELPAVVRAASDRVLARAGLEGTTIRAVATEAGVSPQAIYNRYRTLDRLLDDVTAVSFRSLIAEVLARLVPPDPSSTALVGPPAYDPLAAVTELFRCYRRFAVASAARHHLMFGRAIPEHGAAGRARDDWFGAVVAVVTRASDAGLLLPGDPRVLAERVWVVAHGAVLVELTGVRPGRTARLAAVDARGNGIGIGNGDAFEAGLATVIRGLRPRAQLR